MYGPDFSLAIWKSITKEYPNNYASAIRHNVNYVVTNGRSIIIIINIITGKLDCHMKPILLQLKQNTEMD